MTNHNHTSEPFSFKLVKVFKNKNLLATDTLYFENLTDNCAVSEMFICLTGNKSRKFSIQFFSSYQALPAVRGSK
jgi:hypothetical protein